jgi:hypothetical protein
MDDDDYFVAMAYDHHIVFVTFACLDWSVNLRWLITCLIVLNMC